MFTKKKQQKYDKKAKIWKFDKTSEEDKQNNNKKKIGKIGKTSLNWISCVYGKELANASVEIKTNRKYKQQQQLEKKSKNSSRTLYALLIS